MQVSPQPISQEPRLSTSHHHDEYQSLISCQEEKSGSVPWKGICLAWALFAFGLTFAVLGSMLLAGYFHSKSLDGVTPYALLVVGLTCLIPGGYHILSAAAVFCGHRGYSWDDIPNFD